MFESLIEDLQIALSEGGPDTLANQWIKKSRRRERGKGKDSRGRTAWIKTSKDLRVRRDRRRSNEADKAARTSMETPIEKRRSTKGYASPGGINRPVHNNRLRKDAERSATLQRLADRVTKKRKEREDNPRVDSNAVQKHKHHADSHLPKGKIKGRRREAPPTLNRRR